MGNEELIKQFEREFEKIKKDLGFKSSLEELDKVFFLRDFILKENYVATKLSRMVCGRIVDTYYSWANYLQGLLMPNPGHMLSMTESQVFDENEKEEIFNLCSKVMALVSRNSLVGITRDKNEEAKFIDESLEFWNKTFSSELERIMKRVKDFWIEKSKGEKK